MQADQNEHLSATRLFDFLAGTLGEMAYRVGRLEEHAESMIRGSPRRQELLVVLQDFDLIRQMMEDCARLCRGASLQGDGMQPSLAGTMRLEVLRERLLQDPAGGAGQRPGRGQETDGCGDLDLLACEEIGEGKPATMTRRQAT